MKKLLTLLMLAVLVFGSISCGTDRIINGQVCETHGLINSDVKCPSVKYCTIVGNAIWGVVLFSTIVAPVYFFGFSVREPCANQ